VPILNLIRQHGLGADCVSGAEVQRALDTGFAPGHIVFAGVGKSDAEIQLALGRHSDPRPHLGRSLSPDETRRDAVVAVDCKPT
jgi:hypothetical protein